MLDFDLLAFFFGDFLLLSAYDELLIADDLLTPLHFLSERLNLHGFFLGDTLMEIYVGAVESHAHFHHTGGLHLGPRDCGLVDPAL